MKFLLHHLRELNLLFSWGDNEVMFDDLFPHTKTKVQRVHFHNKDIHIPKAFSQYCYCETTLVPFVIHFKDRQHPLTHPLVVRTRNKIVRYNCWGINIVGAGVNQVIFDAVIS